MWVLIDGYNLLFATNLVGQGRGPGWLQQARRRLLGRLSESLPPLVCARTVVVFDSQQPADDGRRETVGGIEVEFATDYAEADDLLEAIIKRHPQPKRLAVVSGDHRILVAARRRRAAGFTAERWYDALETGRVLLAPGNPVAPDEDLEAAREPAARAHSWLADLGLARSPLPEQKAAGAPPALDRPLTPRSHDPTESRRARRQLDGDVEELLGELFEGDDDGEC